MGFIDDVDKLRPVNAVFRAASVVLNSTVVSVAS